MDAQAQCKGTTTIFLFLSGIPGAKEKIHPTQCYMAGSRFQARKREFLHLFSAFSSSSPRQKPFQESDPCLPRSSIIGAANASSSLAHSFSLLSSQSFPDVASIVLLLTSGMPVSLSQSQQATTTTTTTAKTSSTTAAARARPIPALSYHLPPIKKKKQSCCSLTLLPSSPIKAPHLSSAPSPPCQWMHRPCRCEERERNRIRRRSFWMVVDMEKKRLPAVVVGLTRRHVISSGSGCSSSPPSLPPPAAADSNINESEGGDHAAELKRKKGKKPKPLKWRSTNSDMNNHRDGEAEEEGSDGGRDVDDDTVLSSLPRSTTGCGGSLIGRKRARTLGKVAEDRDAVDPPVPRKLRSAIIKRVGQTAPSSPRHAKKRRHLSAISAQIFLMDRETRTDETMSPNSFTKEEEVLADTLLALSQIAPPSEPTADAATERDISNTNVASTSCSEGVITPTGAIKEDDKITLLPTDANKVVKQSGCADQQVEPTATASVPQLNPALGAPRISINPDFPKDGQIQDLSLGLFAKSPSPPKESLNRSAWKKPKAHFDGSLSLTNQTKKEAPHWLLNHNKSGFAVHDRTKDENSSAKEVTPAIQAPLPCTSTGSSKKPSSSILGGCTISGTEITTAWATANNDKLSLPENGGPARTWKRSVSHVYVSHLIQNHLDKEKASQNQVIAQERSRSCISSTASGSTLNKNGMHFDGRVPVQSSIGVCDTAAGRQAMASNDFMNMPTSAAFSGPQYVQYIHPQMIPTHRGPAQYQSYAHLPCSSRGNVAPVMSIQQQMQQYMCSPGYAPHPGVPASQAGMKLQQFAPTPQQQQQQMWQFHFSQYQPRQAAEGAAAAWQNGRLRDMPSSGSLRPMQALHAPPSMPPPQMELLCGPYQGGGGGGGGGARRPPQLRLI